MSIRIFDRNDPLRRAITLLDVAPGRVALAIAAGCAALGSALGLAAVSAWLIARASQQPPILFLQVAVVSVRALGLGRGIFRYLERLASHDVALRGVATLRERLYVLLSEGRIDAVLGLRRGDMLARVGADVDAVGDVVIRSLVPVAVAVVLSTGAVVLVGVYLPAAGLALAVCLLAAGAIAPMLAIRAARDAEERSVAAKAGISTTSLGLLDDAGELAVSGGIARALTALDADEQRLTAATDSASKPASWSALVTNLAVGVAVIAALLLGIPATTAGTLDPVILAVIVLTPLAAFEAVNAMPAAAVQFQTSRAAARRIMALIDSAATSASAQPAPVPAVPDEDAGDVILSARSLAVGWSGATVVTGVDLDIRLGHSTAIVGPSGCGKTTLLVTLAGLIAPIAGELDRHCQVAYTAEDAHVFETTVLENLRVARGDVTPEEARAVLHRVGLSPWLSALPDGIDTMLGSDAATISGGERRRLLLARALLTTAPLILIDEPAEHLDTATADALLTDLLRIGTDANRAVVIVTHLVDPLAAADEVIVIGPGSDSSVVVARGSHESLLTVDSYLQAMDD